MFKIERGTTTIQCSRGDAGSFDLRIPVGDDYYTFSGNDIITFNVYEKNGYNKAPMLSKNFECKDGSQVITIFLTEEDTTFGEIPNKSKTYWYDITLNKDQTIVCYNEDGPKEFIQYPAKGDEE